MSRKIYTHRYLMQSRRGLNSRSHTTDHEGALIRVDIDGKSGYGCLHPWEELGDASLDELISQLSEGVVSRQVSCALQCADIDRAARAKGVSLFDGLSVPASHATIVGGVDKVAVAVEQGFDTVKLKMGRDVEGDLKRVREVYSAFPELKLRFDFNGVLGEGQIVDLVKSLGTDIVNQVDFFEDPCRLGKNVWEELRDVYGVKTAVDRGVERASKGNFNIEFDYSVIKPAVNKADVLCDLAQLNGRNVIVTSYMDHPLGQSYAAYMAGVLDAKYLGVVNERNGLMTHGLYEPTAFTERLGKVSPVWQHNPAQKGDTGLGFDDLLDSLDWQSC